MVQKLIQIEQVFEQAIPVYRAFTSAAQGFAWRFPALIITDFELDWGQKEVRFVVAYESPLMGLFFITLSAHPAAVLHRPLEISNGIHTVMQEQATAIESEFKKLKKVEVLYALHIR